VSAHIREDDHCRIELDEHGQGTVRVHGADTIARAYWACGWCGEATGGPGLSCALHPSSLLFLKHDRIPVVRGGGSRG
jgi:hypothetical protein